ncbi:MAG TPA: DivIVA domain-containing protein [Jiangellaceae bacterium]
MPLHPDDIVRKTFRTTALRKGYDENEVDTFLEEVVIELRRLRRQVDEDQAEIDRLRLEVAAGASTQLAIEEQQLEQVRREREALAVELRDADRRLAQASEDVARAEADREARLEEIQARLDDDLSVLKKRARDAREEARQMAEQARREEADLFARLASLRAEVEEAVAAELGQEHVADLIAGLEVAQTADPMIDLRVTAALAEAVRRDHLERGRTEAEHVRAEAEAERELIIADVTQRAKALLDTAQQQHDELLQTAAAEHDRLIAEGQRTHDDMLRTAAEQVDRMLTDAREERDSILTDLTARHDQLQARIDELDRFQHEYRDRVRGLMADQMRVLDAGEWHR